LPGVIRIYGLLPSVQRSRWVKADILHCTPHARLTPIADICSALAHVCYGPIADIFLFDYLVSTREQRRRHVEAYCLRSLKVDDKLVFGRRLHRKVGRLLAL
jgi:hypothetical protein